MTSLEGPYHLERDKIPDAVFRALNERFKEVSFSIYGDPVGPDWRSRMLGPLPEDPSSRYIVRGVFTEDTANIGAVTMYLI